MRNISRALVIVILASSFAFAESPVKKSPKCLCHDTTSSYYERITTFEAFDNMLSCVDSGGRTANIYKKNRSDIIEDASYDSEVYDRKSWAHWSDNDRDCQDTRAEVLIKQSTTKVKFSGSVFKSCYVKTGEWYDPYSNENYTDVDDLDVDHIVPLAYAHARGGSKWNRSKKENFANDHDNLVAVQNSLIREKNAKGPSEWMPPHQNYRCEYIQRFDIVVRKYNLEYLSSEVKFINNIKRECGL